MAGGNYSGRVALVTGSRRGVGRLISEHLLEEGANVLGMARGEATFEHERYRHFQVDLAEPKAIEKAFLVLRRESPNLHILINNAAALTSQYSLIMAAGAAQEMVNTNLLGAFLMSREAAKLMRKGKWGRIINISSMAVSLEPAGDTMYAATKAGLCAMGNVMAKEFAPFGITVNALGITAIETDMLRQLPQEKIQAIIDHLPISRFAEAKDILNVIDFFASEQSSYITAQTLYLGGVH
jgi:3-oxoacyl-[acyl-carrier protein] reductase